MVQTMPAWDDAYRSRGSLWGGAIPKLPDLPERSRVLDLGCGSGRILPAMTGRGWNIVAADISGHAVRISRAAGIRFPDAEFLVADGRLLPFRDTAFDAIFAWHVLGHLNDGDRTRMVGELARVLTRDGRVFFRGFSRADMRFGKGKETEPGTFLRGNGISTHYFSEEDTAEIFSGFSPEGLTTETWAIRIRGKDHIRSEIAGTFVVKK
ncbi:MAG: class I SAM-dependent methyltransferase [Methanoregulaceae archaeon]